MNEVSTTLMSWNIKSGGFDGYGPNAPLTREDPIKNFIQTAQTSEGVASVVLPDAHRWENQYGGESGVARHLGFASARYALLNDDRLSRDDGSDIGIAFVTNDTIEQSASLDLDTRQGLGVVLNLGGKSLQLACVYLDDLSEDVRIKQLRALDQAIQPDVPTILLGDFNLLRPEFKGAPMDVQLRDLGVRTLAKALGSRSGLGISVNGMHERRAYSQLLLQGYTDADHIKKRPTAPARLPLFGIDYAFSRGNISLLTPTILSDPSASDHRALITTATLT